MWAAWRDQGRGFGLAVLFVDVEGCGCGWEWAWVWAVNKVSCERGRLDVVKDGAVGVRGRDRPRADLGAGHGPDRLWAVGALDDAPGKTIGGATRWTT